jgi:hypothetical protein
MHKNSHTQPVDFNPLLQVCANYSDGLLGKVVGEGCHGVKAFYMGSSASDEALWSVRCSNGESYAVMISPDASGSTRVLSCATLKAMNAGECFKKF